MNSFNYFQVAFLGQLPPAIMKIICLYTDKLFEIKIVVAYTHQIIYRERLTEEKAANNLKTNQGLKIHQIYARNKSNALVKFISSEAAGDIYDMFTIIDFWEQASKKNVRESYYMKLADIFGMSFKCYMSKTYSFDIYRKIFVQETSAQFIKLFAEPWMKSYYSLEMIE